MELTAKQMQPTGIVPSPREAHSMLLLDSHRVIVFGGSSISHTSGPQQFNDLYILDTQELKWSCIACTGQMPCPRSGHTCTLLEDGQVLVFGGSSMDSGYLNDVFLLNTKEWKWSSIQPAGMPPSPRDKHSACLYGSKLYVFGGFGPSFGTENDHGGESDNAHDSHSDSTSGDGENVENGSCEEVYEEDEDGSTMSFSWFDGVHVLDLSLLHWDEVFTSGEKPSPRAAHTAVIFTSDQTDLMLIFGGRDSSGRQNDLYMLDMKKQVWEKVDAAKPPSPRSFHVMVPLGDSSLALSYGGIGAEGELFNGMELLNLKTRQWTIVNASGSWPPLRGGSAMVACPGLQGDNIPRVIIFGGSRILEGMEPVYFNDLHAVEIGSLIQALC